MRTSAHQAPRGRAIRRRRPTRRLALAPVALFCLAWLSPVAYAQAVNPLTLLSPGAVPFSDHPLLAAGARVRAVEERYSVVLGRLAPELLASVLKGVLEPGPYVGSPVRLPTGFRSSPDFSSSNRSDPWRILLDWIGPEFTLFQGDIRARPFHDGSRPSLLRGAIPRSAALAVHGSRTSLRNQGESARRHGLSMTPDFGTRKLSLRLTYRW